MEIANVVSVIRNSNTKKFRVKFEDGTTEVMRLFVHTAECVCQYRYKSVKFGYPISVEKWVSIKPINGADVNTKVKNFMQNVVKYLNESGLWVDIKESFEKILALGDDYLNHVLSLDWSEQRKYMNETIGTTFQLDSIVGSALKGIVSINYPRYSKEELRNKVRNAIENNTEFHHRWRKGYDNSVDIRLCEDGKKRGWYSEEYRNCGNGHYYLALDERRAIFCEDD